MLRAPRKIRTAGFSIIELMISVALFLILSAAIMSSMTKPRYASTAVLRATAGAGAISVSRITAVSIVSVAPLAMAHSSDV